tara:strand:- start:135 stop:782 length:648 start_codon:yes stop_codon:yes gene_type:complete
MRPINLQYTPSPVSDNNVFLSQTVAGAGSIVINGAGSTDGVWESVDGLSHLISFTAGADASATTLTITGFVDVERRIPRTESIAAPNTTTISTTSYFTVITSITTDVGLTVATKGGIAQEARLPRTVLNYLASPVTVGIGVVITGTIDYTVQHSFNNPQDIEDEPTWFPTLNMSAVTVNTDGNLAAGVSISTVSINTYTSGATIDVTYVQGAFSN